MGRFWSWWTVAYYLALPTPLTTQYIHTLLQIPTLRDSNNNFISLPLKDAILHKIEVWQTFSIKGPTVSILGFFFFADCTWSLLHILVLFFLYKFLEIIKIILRVYKIKSVTSDIMRLLFSFPQNRTIAVIVALSGQWSKVLITVWY